MSDFPGQERCQPVTAGQSIKKIIGRNVLVDRSARIPIREILQGALPNHLIFLLINVAQAIFIKRERIGAPQQSTSARPFPFSIFLFQFPGFELSATPPKMFRRDTANPRERRTPQPPQALPRALLKKPCPTA